MPKSILGPDNGFSLVELLIAVAISGIVGIAAVTVFTASSRTTTSQVSLTASQQNVRAAMDRMSQHVRVAGFGLPDEETFSLTFGGNTFTRPVDITNSAGSADTLTLVGIGYEAGTLNALGADGCNQRGQQCLSLSSNADFQPGGTFSPLRQYISLGGASFLQVTGVSGSNIITLSAPLEGFPDDFFTITPPPSVFILQALTYSIVTNLTGCSTLQPCLAVQDFSTLSGSGRQVLAQGVEDLQIGIYQTPAGGGVATFSSGATTSSANISALRLNLVGKSETEDRTMIFQLPALEDRPAGPNDSFRRRVLTKVVKIRNPRPSS